MKLKAQYIVILILSLVSCLSFGQSFTERLFEQIASEVGPVIAPEKAPYLHQAMSEVFDRLATAQVKLAGKAAVAINKVYIVESSTLNAFVSTDEETGKRIQRNHVFITTGLINKMTEGLTPEEGLKNIIGIFAHELGHPMDSLSEHRGQISIADHYGQIASQMIEIKADFDGSLIAKEAGLPIDSVYSALTRLHVVSPHKTNIFTAGSSTHPEINFRLTNLRFFLTMLRLIFGIPPRPLDIAMPDMKRITSEAEALMPKRGDFPYQAPKDFSTAVERLTILGDSYGLNRNFYTLEYNRLILSADHFLEEIEKEGRDLTDSEKEHFKKFLGYLEEFRIPSENGYMQTAQIAEGHNIRLLINSQTGESNLGNSRAHVYYLDQLKIYRGELVKEYLKDKLAKARKRSARSEATDDLKDFLQLTRVSAGSLFFDVFGDEVRYEFDKIWKAESKKEVPYRAQLDMRLIEQRGLNFAAEFLRIISFGEDNKIDFTKLEVFQKIFEQTSMALPLKNPGNFNERDTSKLSFGYSTSNDQFKKMFRQSVVLARSSNDPVKRDSAQKIVDNIKNQYQKIWQQKGLYGVYDLLMPGAVIDWSLIFEVLNLDPQRARQEIARETELFLKDGIRYIGQPSAGDILSAKKLSAIEGKGVSQWLDWSTKRATALLNATVAGSHAEVKVRSQYLEKFLARSEGLLRQIQAGTLEPILTPVDLIKRYYQVMSPGVVGEIRAWDSTFYFKNFVEFVDQSSVSENIKKSIFNDLLFGKDIKGTDFKEKEEEKTEEQKAWEAIRGQALDFLDVKETAELAFLMAKKYLSLDSLPYVKQLRNSIPAKEDLRSRYFSLIDMAHEKLGNYFKTHRPGTFDEALAFSRIFEPFISRKIYYQTTLGFEAETRSSAEVDAVSSRFLGNTNNIKRLKTQVLESISHLNLTIPQRYRLFLTLTESGSTPAFDQFFLETFGMKVVDGKLIAPESTSPAVLSKIESTLKEGRIHSSRIQLLLTRLVLADQVKKVFLSESKNLEHLNELIETKINVYVPKDSAAKDEYLEEIGWKRKLKDINLGGLIEDQKGTNWKKVNPSLINLGSSIVSEISNFTPQERMEMIEYVLNPDGSTSDVLVRLQKSFEEQAFRKLWVALKGEVSKSKESQIRLKARRTAEVLRGRLEQMISESTPNERLPLLEALMTSGKSSLWLQPEWRESLSRNFLKIPPGSKDESILLTFLEVIPAHEVPVLMSYFLANTGEETGSAAKVFELFDTVGIKFGQLGAIFNLFGEKISKDAERLKSQAKPLSRDQILRLAEERVYNFGRYVSEVEHIIGSASVKTVSLVTLANGNKAVMMLQGSDLEDKIKMNVELGKAFIRKLRDKNLIENSVFLELLIEAMDSQLGEEIDFVKEAEKFKEADRIINELNKDMAADLSKAGSQKSQEGSKTSSKTWEFKVPRLVKDMPLNSKIAFYDVAEGVPFEELSPEMKTEIGPLILKANLKSLFKYGYFDPDRHKGNWMIDPKTKTIWWLDFGQYVNFDAQKSSFKWDARLTIAEFIKAISEKNSKSVLHYAKLMATNQDNITAQQEANILNKLEEIFRQAKLNEQSNDPNKKDTKKFYLDVVETLVNNGVRIRSEFLFGAIKGLMVLLGEKYVSEDETKRMMEKEIRSLLIKKTPARIIEAVEKLTSGKKPTREPIRACSKVHSNAG